MAGKGLYERQAPSEQYQSPSPANQLPAALPSDVLDHRWCRPKRIPAIGCQPTSSANQPTRRIPHDLMSRYAEALGGVIMQATACNAVHSVEQRLARWLLLAHDRMGKNEFPLTQEFVAMMLGVSRPSVTIVAGTLEKAGRITYRRGRLAIVDRQRLEAASCECYQTATDLLTNVTRRQSVR